MASHKQICNLNPCALKNSLPVSRGWVCILNAPLSSHPARAKENKKPPTSKMSLGLSRVGSAVKLPDLEWARRWPKMSLQWVFTYGVDFMYTCLVRELLLFPLEIRQPCKADDYYVYAVMACPKKKKTVSICGRPFCAPTEIHPANLNIWMVTQEAWNTPFSQSFPSCHSEKVSSAPEGRAARL